MSDKQIFSKYILVDEGTYARLNSQKPSKTSAVNPFEDIRVSSVKQNKKDLTAVTTNPFLSKEDKLLEYSQKMNALTNELTRLRRGGMPKVNISPSVEVAETPVNVKAETALKVRKRKQEHAWTLPKLEIPLAAPGLKRSKLQKQARSIGQKSLPIRRKKTPYGEYFERAFSRYPVGKARRAYAVLDKLSGIPDTLIDHNTGKIRMNNETHDGKDSLKFIERMMMSNMEQSKDVASLLKEPLTAVTPMRVPRLSSTTPPGMQFVDSHEHEDDVTSRDSDEL